MAFNIANFFESERRSARAGESMGHGMIVKVLDWGNGERKLMKLGAADAAYLSGGKYAVVTKFGTDANEVDSSTSPAAIAGMIGSRIVTIISGDHVVEIRTHAIMEYSKDLLDTSLQTGAITVGQDLGVASSKWSTTAASDFGAGGPVIGRVFRVFGSKVLIELL